MSQLIKNRNLASSTNQERDKCLVSPISWLADKTLPTLLPALFGLFLAWLVVNLLLGCGSISGGECFLWFNTEYSSDGNY